MVFKPFKPPLIKRPPQAGANPDATDKDPPPKKQRLSHDREPLSATQKERKPLLQLRYQNGPEGNHGGDDDSVEKYYNVLWSVDAQFTPEHT